MVYNGPDLRPPTILVRKEAMTRHRRFTVLALLVAAFTAPPSSGAGAPERTHDLVPEDYFTQGFINDCAISPDGRYVALADLRWDMDADTRHTDVWVANVKTKEMRRLTFHPGGDDGPRWGPDGRWVYFTSARGDEDLPPENGETQVWKASIDGGVPVPVTRFKEGVENFALAADGKTLYYVKSSEQVEDPWKELKEKYDDLDYGKGVMNYDEIWALDLETWRTEKLVAESRVIREFTVSRDGSRIAMITTPTEELITNEGLSTVDVWDRESGAVTRVSDRLWRDEAPSPYGWIEGVSWSADASKLAFRVDFDGHPAELFVVHFAAGEATPRKLRRPGEFHLGGSPDIRWIGTSNDLCFISEERARARVAVVRDVRPGSQGAYEILTPGDVVAKTFDLTPDGKTLAAALGDVTQPNDVFVGPPKKNGKLERITRINPQIDNWRIPKIEVVKWAGAKGDTVEGILELPHDHEPGTKLPLHVALHGGPTAADLLYLEFWIYGRGLWPALGWAVFAPNYRGSTGFGDRFMTDLVGAECGIEVEDVMAGVDMLIEKGIADPERMAVSGWSNGGFVTNCIITKTDRFKAASTGAGVLDMGLQWGIEDTPGHVINFMEGLPWEKPDEYIEASPLWALDKVKTPTLIHVGEKDPRVPSAHSKALFRGLDFYLGVPSELVIYPGQGHGLNKYTHRLAKMKWDMAWFDHYVLGKMMEGEE